MLQGQIPRRDVGESGIHAGRRDLDQVSVPVVLEEVSSQIIFPRRAPRDHLPCHA